MMSVDEMVQEQLQEAWQSEILDHNTRATPTQQHPQGFVLGGQPGAGKSSLILKVKEELEGNVIVINGDDYRKYHPDYAKFQAQDTKDSAPKTQEFAGKMTEAILQKAIKEKYNIVIEGTFRTAQTPIQTLKQFKENGYQTQVMIQTCNKELSWESCLERYNKMLEVNPQEARYTPKEHHDLVCENLAQNIEKVCQSGFVDKVQIYKRDKENTQCIFKSDIVKNALEDSAQIKFKKEVKEIAKNLKLGDFGSIDEKLLDRIEEVRNENKLSQDSNEHSNESDNIRTMR